MAKQVIKVESPLLGLNRVLGREQQPENSFYDSLNVLPFDRTGRLRIGQRAGTDNLWASAIGGSQTVQNLNQATIALDPTTITANTTLLTEPFTYSNGNLETVATTAVWKTYTGATGVEAAARFAVASNKVASDGTAGIAVYQPTLTLGAAFIVKATLNWSTLNAANTFGVVCRITKAAPDQTTGIFLMASVSNTGVLTLYLSDQAFSATGFTPSGPASFTSVAGFVTTAVDHTLELRCNGNNFQGYFDGVPYVTGSSSTDSTQSGVGFVANSANATFDNFIVQTGQALASYRQTHLIAVSGGSIYDGDISTQGTLVNGGSAQLNTTGLVSSAQVLGKMYFVDGVSTIKKLDILTKSMQTYTTSGGSETTTTLGQYTIACIWRNRLILGADRTNPQNFIASKIGDPMNWDYTAGTPDGAFAGNAAKSGQIGDPITALIPFTNDVLMIGGDHNIWFVHGDPADGGSIDLISDAAGVYGKDAWTKAPDGTLYFCGPGGFFKIPPGSDTFENVSLSKYPQFFANINRGTQYVILNWDRDRHGCYIHVTPVNTGTATHLWYDQRTDSFWPIQYPDSHGPISSLVYDGDSANDRQLLLGGRTGIIQKVSATNRIDDGATISSYVIMGPFNPFPGAAGKLTGVTIDGGELAPADSGNADRYGMTATGKAAVDAYGATEGTAHATFAVDCPLERRQKTFRQRLRGGWFTLTLANSAANNYFAFESVTMEFEPSGRLREIR